MSERRERTAEHRYRVLVVGDSDDVKRTTERLRRAFGTDAVESVSTVDDAVDHVEDVDCFLCEPEAVSSLRPHVTVPIVALTVDESETAISTGATDVVSPAATVDVLRARIGNAVGETIPAADRRSLERCRSILDAILAVVFVTDAAGTITWASPAAERALEYTPSELEGDTLDSVVHPTDRPDIEDCIDAVSDGTLDERVATTGRVRRGDGRLGLYRIDVRNRLDDPTLSGLVWTIVPDRTRETGEQTAPRVTHERPRELDRIDDPILTVDEDWIVTDVNAAGRRDFSLDDESPVGLEFWDLLPGSTVSTWFERLSEAQARSSPVDFRVPTETDETYAVRAYPADDALTVVAMRREASISDSAREELERLSALLDAVPGLAILVEGDRIAIANAATFEYTDSDVVVGRTLPDVFGPDVAEQISDRVDAQIRRIDPIEWSSPTDRVLDLEVAPLPDGRASVVGTDVTTERRFADGVTTLAAACERIGETSTHEETRRQLTTAARSVFDVSTAVWYRRSDDRLTAVRAVGAGTDATPPPVSIPDEFLPSIDAGEPAVLDPDAIVPLADSTVLIGPLVVPITPSDLIVVGDAVNRERVGSDVPDRDAVSTGPDSTDTRSTFPALGALLRSIGTLALARMSCLADTRQLSASLDSALEYRTRVETLQKGRLAIDGILRQATTRSTVETSLCRELADLDDVRLAWIGTRSHDTIEVRASAGDARTYPSELSTGARSSEPVATAATSDEQVVESVAPGNAGDPWEAIATSHGIRSVVATPIRGREREFGVLGVYLSRELEDDPVVPFCADVAAGTFLGIDAIETRQALLSGDTVELELSVSPSDGDVLTTLAVELSTTIELEAVAHRDDRSTLYVTIHGEPDGSPTAVLENAASVLSATRLSDSETGERYEVEVEDEALIDIVARFGGTVTTVAGLADAATVRIDLPADRDVRPIVEALRGSLPNVELVARRPTERRTGPTGGRRDLLAKLTDRQREILRTAYAAGYFESPRTRTGEDIAARLDISQPTFTRHIRAAERAVFDTLFGGSE